MEALWNFAHSFEGGAVGAVIIFMIWSVIGWRPQSRNDPKG